MAYPHAAASLPSSPQLKPAYQTIGLAGLIAGSLDLATALIEARLEGKGPIYLLQAIAGGMLGMETFHKGLASAALGTFFHFLIALTAAAVFYIASRTLKFLVKQSVLSGVLYGIAVYCFMSFVVLPLSAYHMTIKVPPVGPVIKDVAVHIFMVGLPISLVVHKFSS